MIARIFFLSCFLLTQARAAEWMTFPAFERTVLPNGITLLLMEKHEAPLVTLTLALRSGSTHDPAGKEGLAEVTNELLRKGAGTRSAGEISEDLDFIGAQLETSTTLEMTKLQLDFLVKDMPKGLELFTDLILRPNFPTNEVDKLLKQQVDEIRAAKDQPLEVLPEYYRSFLFAGHPYGRPQGGTEKTLPSITRPEIADFHKATYVSSNMVMIAIGDFKTADLRAALSNSFGTAAATAAPQSKVASPEKASVPRLLLVDKPDATQTFFAIGNTGLAIDDPDRLTASLVNVLFGGRFTSRLNTALRIDSGLSYGARSAFTPARYPGGFTISSFTKNESTEQALDAALKVLSDLQHDGLTSAELDSGKAYMKGQFGPTLETPAQLAARLALFEIYGLSAKEEVDRYAARLDAITLADVRRVIDRLFPTKNLVFAVIGKGEAIDDLLKKYAASTRTISISEPGFGD